MAKRVELLKRRAVEHADAAGVVADLATWWQERVKQQGVDVTRGTAELTARESLRECPVWIIEALTSLWHASD